MSEGKEKINVLSCFDGISCGQVAINRAGIAYANYYASEVDKYAISVTQANFPNTIQLGDVTKVKGVDLPKIDLLIGGSPCQGFSFAGSQLNFQDERSKLFFEFVRLKNELQPKYFLLENVKMKKEYQDIISALLGVRPIAINSGLVSAQNRQRLYWTNIPINGMPENHNIKLKDIVLSGEPLKEKSQTILATLYKENAKSMIKRKKHGLLINDNGTMRKFNPIECERLQTLPDGYTANISDTQRYKTLGNGWTVDVITFIFSFCAQEIFSVQRENKIAV